MCFGGGESKAAKQARRDEEAREKRIREGTDRIGTIFGENFGDDFFGGRKNAFMSYATPQLEDQYTDATKQLTYALARSGTLDSSVRGEKAGELQKLYDLRKQEVADEALSHETSARSNVENARSDLITVLNATGDAEGAANSALARAKTLSAPQQFSPLASLFSSFTSTLGSQAALERAEAASGGAYKPRYNTGLFGNTGGSVVNR